MSIHLVYFFFMPCSADGWGSGCPLFIGTGIYDFETYCTYSRSCKVSVKGLNSVTWPLREKPGSMTVSNKWAAVKADVLCCDFAILRLGHGRTSEVRVHTSLQACWAQPCLPVFSWRSTTLPPKRNSKVWLQSMSHDCKTTVLKMRRAKVMPLD